MGQGVGENKKSENKNKAPRNIGASIFFGALGAFMALLFSAFAGYLFIDLSFLSSASCGAGDDHVYCFFDEKWDSGTYLSTITGFYSTIITLLFALLGVVAGLAFIVIRGSALQQAEESIEREVDRYFETNKAEEKIRKGLETVGSVELEKIGQRLEEIEVALEEAGLLPDGSLEDGNAKKTEEAD